MYSSDNIFEILVDFEKEERLRKEYEEAIIKKMRIATVMNAKGWVPDEYYLQMVFNDAFFKWDESKIKEE